MPAGSPWRECAVVENSRSYVQKTALVDSTGQHVKYVPAALASATVAGSAAEVHNANGKVKAIRLVTPANTHGRLIGPPSEPGFGVRFTRREMLDESGTRSGRITHARCTRNRNRVPKNVSRALQMLIMGWQVDCESGRSQGQQGK
jgi:hypothetical protein